MAAVAWRPAGYSSPQLALEQELPLVAEAVVGYALAASVEVLLAPEQVVEPFAEAVLAADPGPLMLVHLEEVEPVQVGVAAEQPADFATAVSPVVPVLEVIELEVEASASE